MDSAGRPTKNREGKSHNMLQSLQRWGRQHSLHQKLRTRKCKTVTLEVVATDVIIGRVQPGAGLSPFSERDPAAEPGL
jgi:hypothetical protein